MGDGDDPGALVHETGELFHVELAAVVDRHHAQPGAGLPAYDLPRNDVRMVLHRGDDDLVTRSETGPRIALCDQVQPLGGAAHEDDLAAVGRVQERLGRVPRRLVGARCALAQRMQSPVDVRIVGFVIAADRIDDPARLLARCAVVEVHERPAVDLLIEDRKLGADPLDIEHVGRRLRRKVRCVAHWRISCRPPPPGRCPSTAAPIGSRRPGRAIRSTTSRANPYVSMPRAALSAIPRERR